MNVLIKGEASSNYLPGSESSMLAYDSAIPIRTVLLPFPFSPLTLPYPCRQPQRHQRQQLADEGEYREREKKPTTLSFPPSALLLAAGPGWGGKGKSHL